MLTTLSIKNIALIESLEIEFSKGLNVLSGETGAGKSIIIDSINFVLGKRADKTLIRYGEESATVTAFFDIDNDKIYDILDELEIEKEDELMIKRTMTIDGKNNCSINGQKVTLSMLRQLTSKLVDIYGQNDALFIMNPSMHLEILDNYGLDKVKPLKDKQEALYKDYKETLKKLKEYGNLDDLEKNLELYEYQINEIKETNFKDGEEEELKALRSKMNNSQEFVESLSQAYESLNGSSDVNVNLLLSNAIKALNKVVEFDSSLEDIISRLESAKIDLKDAGETIEDIAKSSEFDPQKANQIENRLNKIRLIKKKYGASEQEINDYLSSIQDKYDFLNNGEEKLADLEIDKKNLFEDLYKNAKELSHIRHNVAFDLSLKIEKELKELGMKDAQFVAKFNEFPLIDEIDSIPANGLDEMEFLFSANKGQPPRELTKIISGGELSRFTLALKNTISDLDGIDTMIFDEIDTGISGHIAQVVAEKLYSISKDKQVLAITHIPQLASIADTNFLIVKNSDNLTTKTKIIKLEKDDLINEIIRLVGGETSEKTARPHAIEMLENAKKLKENL